MFAFYSLYSIPIRSALSTPKVPHHKVPFGFLMLHGFGLLAEWTEKFIGLSVRLVGKVPFA